MSPLNLRDALFKIKMKKFAVKLILILIYIIIGGKYFPDNYQKIVFSLSIILLALYLFNLVIKKIIDKKKASISLLLYLIIIAYSSYLNEYNLAIFGINCLLVGFYEELIFRYVLYFQILQKKKLIKYAIIVAIIFSLAHFPNLRRYDLYSVLTQSYLAFLISIIFTAILVKFKSIILVGCIHGMINFFGTLNRKLSEYKVIPNMEKNSIENNDFARLIDSLISVSILLIPFVLISLFYLRKTSLYENNKSEKK